MPAEAIDLGDLAAHRARADDGGFEYEHGGEAIQRLDQPVRQPIGGWSPDRPGRTLLGMPIELLSRDLVRTVDSIELPPPDRPVEGRSSREDSYTIHVTTSLEATVERLVELIGDRSVAILTDSTVMDLYGPTVVRALERYSIHPEVGVVPAGERHKTLSRAFDLLEFLTGTHDAGYISGAVLRVDGGLLSG